MSERDGGGEIKSSALKRDVRDISCAASDIPVFCARFAVGSKS